MFSGDLIYKGMLYANYPSTNPCAFLDSVEKIAGFPVKRVFPGHHSLDIQPEIITRIKDGLHRIEVGGKLIHGSGIHDLGGLSILL